MKRWRCDAWSSRSRSSPLGGRASWRKVTKAPCPRSSARQALAVAWGRVGRIAAWALIAAVVGLLIEQVASRLPGGGRIVARVAGYGWSLASLFAIPILALEDCSPIDCLKRSAARVKECWGEGIAGTVIITAWTTIAILVLGVAAAVAIPAAGSTEATIIFAFFGGLALVAIIAAQSVVRQTFVVALSATPPPAPPRAPSPSKTSARHSPPSEDAPAAPECPPAATGATPSARPAATTPLGSTPTIAVRAARRFARNEQVPSIAIRLPVVFEPGSQAPSEEPLESRAPTTEQLLQPVLDALADGQTRDIPMVASMAADLLGLDAATRALKIPSGALRIEHRVGWARTSLVRAGLVEQPAEAAVRITDAGREALASAETRIDDAYLRKHCPGYAAWIADMGGELPEDERAGAEQPVVWLVRAGRGGIYAPDFVELKAVVVGWGDTGDVTGLSREEIRDRTKDCYPGITGGQLSTSANVLYRLANTMKPGDLVLTPEPASRTLLMGRVDGPYGYLDVPLGGDVRHSRQVRWFARVERDELSYGAKNTIGTLLTFARPSYETEFSRLAELHAADAPPDPLAQNAPAAAAAAAAAAPQRVSIPPDVTLPRPQLRDDFQTVSRKLLQLLGELDSGLLALPDFQRSFVWAPDATRELIVSIIRSFPAGALLFLQGGGAAFKARAAEQAPPLSVAPNTLVLDGQQRLTSLYQALYGVGLSRFFLDMGALLVGADVNEAVRVLPAERAASLEAVEAQASALVMPLSTVTNGGAGRWRDEVVALRADEDESRTRELLRGLEEAYVDPLVRYAFPVTTLPPDTELEAVCTIFETLNRTGKPLTPFELISARAFAGGHSLHDYWGRALQEHPILSDYEIDPYYVLQVIALRLGLPCKRGTVLSLPADDIAAEWSHAIADTAAAMALLRDECGVLAPKWLPYRPMLIPLAASWREIAAASGPAEGAMRSKLKRWFWCAAFTGEYESSSATLAERDTPVLKAWLNDGLEPPVVANFSWNPQRWETVSARQQGLYRATLALTLTNHPRDFHTGAPLTRERIEAQRVDDHHVFPRAYLAEIGLGGGIDSVLNHCLIDRQTNLGIGRRAPSIYLSEIRRTLGAELDRVLASQMLPVGADSPLGADDFDGFRSWRMDQLYDALIERAGSYQTPVEQLDPQRTKLNAKLEAAELELRELVLVRLDGDANALPDHIAVKARERLEAAARKDPTRRIDESPALAEQLQYFDLRDLQELLTAKRTWERFESMFRSRDMLNMRFMQLAELRNAIRHSRELTGVMIKDGEAALLWFEEALENCRHDR
jgi:hypothetical protein